MKIMQLIQTYKLAFLSKFGEYQIKLRRFDPTSIRNDDNAVVITDDGEQFIIWHHKDHALHLALGSRGALVRPVLRKDSGEMLPNLADLIIDNNFDRMPEKVKGALLWHEYGHVVLGHMVKSSTHMSFTVNPSLEMEADAYSVKNGQDMVGALVWMKHNIKDVDVAVIDQRITHLISAAA